jgi:hypothetical protein
MDAVGVSVNLYSADLQSSSTRRPAVHPVISQIVTQPLAALF